MSNVAEMTVAYQAAMRGDWEGLKDFLRANREGVLLPLTVNRDTALHIAVYSGNLKLVKGICDIAREIPRLPSATKSPFTIKNEYGNTALHEAAAAGHVKAAKLLLGCDRGLLETKNKLGETPLFRAAAFGRTEMVEFLASEVFKDTETVIQTHRNRGPFTSIHSRRDDSTSILHIAVHGEHFETALWLQKKDENLGEMKDDNGRTCLHLLSNMPSAFKSGHQMDRWKGILYACLPEDNDEEDIGETRFPSHRKDDLEHGEVGNLARFCSANVHAVSSRTYQAVWRFLVKGWPAINKIWNEKKRYESAVKLMKLLVKKDTSWESSYVVPDPGTISFGERGGERRSGQGKGRAKLRSTKAPNASFAANESEGGEGSREGTVSVTITVENAIDPLSPHTPLLIATSKGIIEIVDEILQVYPQAVEHVSNLGQNILHVIVKHRQKEIFKRVKRMKIPMTILVRKIDNDGYTLLHHAADMEFYRGGPQPNPALQLQEELRWFRRVQKIIPSPYVMHHNNDGKTAQELFEEKHSKLLKEAQEWLKRTSESCSVIAVLIATVAFTAAYTVPGGSDDKTGLPILLHFPFFLVFTIMDVLSLASSLTSVVMFLSILTSPFQLQDFHFSLPRKLTLGFTFLFLSVSATMLAFTATIVLEIHLKKRWTTSIIYTVTFLPVTMFALLQFPVYVAFTGTLKFFLIVLRKCLPWHLIQRVIKNFLPLLKAKRDRSQ